MIEEFVKIWESRKGEVRSKYESKHPDNYIEVVRNVVNLFDELDSEKIVEIDHGDYQGTLLFVIPEKSYQPCKYFFVMVGYGSCSGCDTLESISNYSNNPPTKEQIDDYILLSLHIVQKIKILGGYEDVV